MQLSSKCRHGYVFVLFQDKPRVTQKVMVDFMKCLNAIVKYVEDQMVAIQKKNRDVRIHLAGHSWGGVHAIYAAVALRLRFRDVPFRVVTFGAPKPGDEKFHEFYRRLDLHKSTSQFQLKNDRVANAPLVLPPNIQKNRAEAKTQQKDDQADFLQNVLLGAIEQLELNEARGFSHVNKHMFTIGKVPSVFTTSLFETFFGGNDWNNYRASVKQFIANGKRWFRSDDQETNFLLTIAEEKLKGFAMRARKVIL